MFKVALIECGAGNIKSMENALLRAEFNPVLVSNAIELKTVDVDLIVLPGVGAFGYVMEQLRHKGLIEELERKVLDCKVPFLGVCVGMQILAKTALEHGEHKGLGWLEGTVNKIQINSDERLPHVGWNCLEPIEGKFLEKFAGQDFYFVHSNAIMCLEEDVAARSTYGNTFVSAVQKENIFGVQFHPEKSSSLGEYFFSCLAREVKNIA
jgi:imidazole glycerol-phosphate synthase subunit HisH